jgi:photosystem II stability/assembly factor-like uncharacterized protein
MNNGLLNQNNYQDIRSFAVLGGSLFAGSNPDGVFYSGNGGSSWTARNGGMLKNISVSSFHTKGSLVFTCIYNDGVFVSSDNGVTWIPKNSGIALGGDRSIMSFLVSGNNIFAGAFTGLYLSTNDGNTWVKQANTNFQTGYVSSLKVIGNSIFAGIKYTKGVQVSTDNGQSWTVINNGLTSLNINALEVNGSNLFAGTSAGGIFISTDNGASWNAVNSGITNLNVTSLSLFNGNLYAGTQGAGVFKSSNNGTSWTPINTGISNLNILSLANDGIALYAGALAGDIFATVNNGASWTIRREGIVNTSILNIGVSGNYIFAGTQTGIWRRLQTELTGVTAASEELPDKFSLSQNYPNPFNPNTVIKFRIKDSRNVILKVYDLKGSEVITLINEKMKQGEYEVSFNGTGLSSGIYFYTLSAGDFRETKKMILLK